jgi:hypothetical protein
MKKWISAKLAGDILLASGVSFENLIAAPITILLAWCALRLAVEK